MDARRRFEYKILHYIMKRRLTRNNILGLNVAGGRIYQVDHVKMEFHNQFKSRFQEPNHIRPVLEGAISEAENNMLEE